MFKQLKDETANSREMITSFLGYNHNLIQNAGEFWDTENISLRNYPVLSPRKLAEKYKLIELNNDYIIDNIVKENEFENAFECEKSIVQKGEGKAPVAFADGIALKGKIPERYEIGKAHSTGWSFASNNSGIDETKFIVNRINIRQAWNSRNDYVNKSLTEGGDASTIIFTTNQNDLYLNQNSWNYGGDFWYASLNIVNEDYILTKDEETVSGKTYYYKSSGKYFEVHNPSYPRGNGYYEKVNFSIYEKSLLNNVSKYYVPKNNIITAININKIHFEKKLRNTDNLKQYGNYYGGAISDGVTVGGKPYRDERTWKKLYVPSEDKKLTSSEYYKEEYDDDGENVTVKALVDILLTFRLKNKDKLCNLRNKSTNETLIMYRGSTATVTIQKEVSIDIKFRLKQDPYCTRTGTDSELVTNTLFTLNHKYFSNSNSTRTEHGYFHLTENDVDEILSDCKDSIETAFTDELFAELDKQDVVSLLQKKAEESLTADDLKITTYFDYEEYINPSQEPKDISVILKNGGVAWSNGKYIGYKGIAYSINQGTAQQSPVRLLSMDTKIIEFPNNVYLDTAALDKGVQPLGVSITLNNGDDGNKPYIAMCDRDGTVLEGVSVSKTEPEDKEKYKYWVDISQSTPSVKVYSSAQALWVNYSTVYARLYGVDINSIRKGDTVRITLNDDKLDGFDNEFYYVYETLSDDNYKGSVVISQLVQNKKELSQDVVISREIPDFDYVTVASNRVWGCKFGKDKNGKQVNQIYASALGDPTNWYVFQNTSEDSYYLTLGDDTEFTGAIALGGYPYFFKENGIYEIYGSYPAAYQLISYEQQGCENGSDKSIAVVDGDIFFKSPMGICVFSNGVVSQISKPLGDVVYHNAVGGGTCGEYYVSMLDENNNSATFVFSTLYSLWIKLNNEMYKQFCCDKAGTVLAIKNDNTIASFGRMKTNMQGTLNNGKEDELEWTAETGPIDYSYPDRKYISNIIIRAIIEADAVLDVYIQYNSDGNWLHCGTLRGNGTPQSSKLTITPQRCDHYAYKFIGSSGASVISIANEIEQTEG